MTNVIRYPLRNMSPAVIRELQEKYPNASVQIELNEAPAEGGLSEQEFWDLIHRLDWTSTGDDAAVIAPVVTALAQRPARHIYDFKDWLSGKLFQLDGRAYAPEQLHPDSFLFARCAVVANGKAYFQEVLSHPEKMPDDVEFAPLLRIAHEAWRLQKGTALKYVAAYPVETFSNQAAWEA